MCVSWSSPRRLDGSASLSPIKDFVSHPDDLGPTAVTSLPLGTGGQIVFFSAFGGQAASRNAPR